MLGLGIGELVGGAVAVGGAAVGYWKKKQLAKVVKEVFDVVQTYRNAKKDGVVSPEEMDRIIDELEEAVISIAGLLRK